MSYKVTVIKLNRGGILSDIEVDSYNNGAEAQDPVSFKAGIRAVLAWEEEHDVIGYVYDTDDPEVEKQNMIDHANQLKEWGL